MHHSQTHLRSRPISAGHLRAFEAVARHLNFRAAAEEMALTQSAVSRQIQSLEEEVGVGLFLRHTRAVELTSAGAQLLLAVQQSLPRIDGAVRQIRQSAGRKSVSLTTFASFASMWLIPRLEAFQRDNPEIDIRIDASDVGAWTSTWPTSTSPCATARARTCRPARMRLFGETLTPVASPWLIKSNPPIKTPADIARFTLIEAGDAHRTHLEWLTWRRWFEVNGLEPRPAQALALLQLRLPDGAGRPHRPGRGAGAQLADRREPGQRRPGRGAAAAPHGFADGLLADHRPAQRAAAGDQGLLRLAAGARPRRTRGNHRRGARPRTPSTHIGLKRVARHEHQPIGQTTPLSFRMASSGRSCASGSKSSRKPLVKPSPTVNGRGSSAASVRS